MYNEQEEKLRQMDQEEKLRQVQNAQYYAQQSGGACGSPQIVGATDTCGNEAMRAEELLIHQLLRKKRRAESDHAKYDRAIGILERHPEFQELIELLRSGIV